MRAIFEEDQNKTKLLLLILFISLDGNSNKDF